MPVIGDHDKLPKHVAICELSFGMADPIGVGKIVRNIDAVIFRLLGECLILEPAENLFYIALLCDEHADRPGDGIGIGAEGKPLLENGVVVPDIEERVVDKRIDLPLVTPPANFARSPSSTSTRRVVSTLSYRLFVSLIKESHERPRLAISLAITSPPLKFMMSWERPKTTMSAARSTE